MSENIRVEVEDGVCTVTIARPEKKNSLTQPMYAGLADAIERAQAERDIRCLLLTGAGEAFCAGNDIGDFRTPRAAVCPDAPSPCRRFYFGLVNFE